MTYTSIFEKLLLIVNIVSTSYVYIAFGLVVISLIVLFGLKKMSKRLCFLLTSLATSLVLGYTVYIYYDVISKLIGSIVDNIFLNIYFPSVYAYLFVLVLINVSTIGNLLNPRSEKIYKNVNGICLIITDFVLSLVLEKVAKDGVDVFAKESIFANTELITLLEFSMNIFIVWLISLVTIYIINNITERIIIARENKKLVGKEAITINAEMAIDGSLLQEEYDKSNVESKPLIENPIQAFIPDKQNRFIPNFTVSTNDIITDVNDDVKNKFIPVIDNHVVDNNEIRGQYATSYVNNYTYDNNSFDLSSFIPKKQDVKPISILNEQTNVNTNQIFEQILKNDLPYAKEEKVVSSIEEKKNTYTLNDYRIFNKMLKDIREHNQSSSITIDKNLEYRLITKYSTETYNMFKTMLKIYSN